jgi:hypothetical protein
MGYVCLRTMSVNGATVQPGAQIATATVDAWRVGIRGDTLARLLAAETLPYKSLTA